jgi:hypothetical protein
MKKSSSRMLMLAMLSDRFDKHYKLHFFVFLQSFRQLWRATAHSIKFLAIKWMHTLIHIPCNNVYVIGKRSNMIYCFCLSPMFRKTKIICLCSTYIMYKFSSQCFLSDNYNLESHLSTKSRIMRNKLRYFHCIYFKWGNKQNLGNM